MTTISLKDMTVVTLRTGYKIIKACIQSSVSTSIQKHVWKAVRIQKRKKYTETCTDSCQNKKKLKKITEKCTESCQNKQTEEDNRKMYG